MADNEFQNGEISYINLNGEKRKIAGAGLNQKVDNTIAAQNTIIQGLREENSNLKSAILETNDGLLSLVKGLKEGSVIEQTEDGFAVIINKVQYSAVVTPNIDENIKEYSLDISLYGDGLLAIDGTFYCKVYGIVNGTMMDLYPDALLTIRDGHIKVRYNYFYNNLMVMVYDSSLYETLLCSSPVSIAKNTSKGTYSIEMVCNQGYVRNSKDTSDIIITTRLFRNGEDIHTKLGETGHSFTYKLYWYSPQDKGNYSMSSDNGIFNIPKDKIDEKTTFYCEVDIDTDAIESGVFNG